MPTLGMRLSRKPPCNLSMPFNFKRRSAFTSAELGYLLLHDEASVGSVQNARDLHCQSVDGDPNSRPGGLGTLCVEQYPSDRPIECAPRRLFRPGNHRFSCHDGRSSLAVLAGGSSLSAGNIESFSHPPNLRNAVAQTKPANARYKNLLILLNRHGRSSGSINVVAQIIADVFSLDLAVAQQLLTEVISRNGQPGEFVINALLDPLFIDSGKEKLAAAIATEFQQDAFSIIEGTSVLTDAEIEAFIVLHFVFLDSEEAKTNLLGTDALTDVLERYQYVTAAWMRPNTRSAMKSLPNSLRLFAASKNPRWSSTSFKLPRPSYPYSTSMPQRCRFCR